MRKIRERGIIMNKVEMLGRLVKDVEILKSKSGNEYAKFTLAVKRKASEETDFFNCTAFGKQVEALAKYTEKGARIIIVGSIQNDSYTDKEGNKKQQTNIIVDEFYFVDFKKELAK